MNIVLINPKTRDLAGEGHPALSLAYLAGAFKKKGYENKLKVLDLQAGDNFEEEIIKKADFIGITSFSYCFSKALEVIKKIRRISKAIVILGGPHASMMGRALLERHREIDYLIMGEGEDSFIELYEGRELSEIGGLVYRKDGKIIENPMRRIENLDRLAWPAYEFFPQDKYLSFPSVISILTSRGCFNKCIFCDNGRAFGKRFRCRSADSVIDEIKHWNKKYGTKEFIFIDDNFVLKRERVFEIADKLIQINLGLKFKMGISIAQTDEEILKVLKKAGLCFVSFGVESTDREVLKTTKKVYDMEKLKRLVRTAKELNIETRGFFIVGLPKDTLEKSKKTFLNAGEIGFDSIGVGVATPYPGTEMYDWVNENGRMLVDIENYLDTQPLTPYYGNIPFDTTDFPKKEREKAYRFAIKIRNKIEHMGIKLVLKALKRVIKGKLNWVDFKEGVRILTKYFTTGYSN